MSSCGPQLADYGGSSALPHPASYMAAPRRTMVAAPRGEFPIADNTSDRRPTFFPLSGSATMEKRRGGGSQSRWAGPALGERGGAAAVTHNRQLVEASGYG